jgi:hypothetical protein
MRGIVNVIEMILETPEIWGRLSLTHEELENLRKYAHDMTKDISDEQAKSLLRQMDLLEAAPDLLAACKSVLAWLNNAPIDYSNGVEYGGYDEGNVRGWQGHAEIVKELETAIARAEGTTRTRDRDDEAVDWSERPDCMP